MLVPTFHVMGPWAQKIRIMKRTWRSLVVHDGTQQWLYNL